MSYISVHLLGNRFDVNISKIKIEFSILHIYSLFHCGTINVLNCTSMLHRLKLNAFIKFIVIAKSKIRYIFIEIKESINVYHNLIFT